MEINEKSTPDLRNKFARLGALKTELREKSVRTEFEIQMLEAVPAYLYSIMDEVKSYYPDLYKGGGAGEFNFKVATRKNVAMILEALCPQPIDLVFHKHEIVTQPHFWTREFIKSGVEIESRTSIAPIYTVRSTVEGQTDVFMVCWATKIQNHKYWVYVEVTNEPCGFKLTRKLTNFMPRKLEDQIEPKDICYSARPNELYFSIPWDKGLTLVTVWKDSDEKVIEAINNSDWPGLAKYLLEV